jgi:hypothetical protein
MSTKRYTADSPSSAPSRGAPGACVCAWKGCDATGAYRAPKDKRLTEYLVFCLEHVRLYNAQWDYHKGCTTADLEAEIRSAATWERPTWKLGSLGGGIRFRPGRMRVDDPFGFAAGTAFDPETWDAAYEREARARRSADPAARAQSEALDVLNLTMPVTIETLKRRYKVLVKKHHPDANGGSPEAETQMKIINQAYQTLRAALATSS